MQANGAFYNPPFSAQVMNSIEYSHKYADDEYEYRHVILPKEIARTLPKNKLLSEAEWRSLGIRQSRGWEHYDIHKPEPHILLFRRMLGTDPRTGEPPAREEIESRKAEAIAQREQEIASRLGIRIPQPQQPLEFK